ncbi:hypothetical protein JEY40_31725 [Bradyrhizobium japonicum]|uniref:hypothetical protein n=1 Tax=Bradyrhizobium japonicum TaxID=375 RepID=UPI00200D608E|nr:hypothetical protein [Bradyrhizobium japonicum]UQD70494.1 hypothetical protein JEY40_31725 [Bradyrhizobium japonicum]
MRTTRPQRGDFIVGAGYPAATAKHAGAELRAEFPLLEGVIDAAGPVPSAERLRELAEERERLLARLAEARARIAELRSEKKR